MLKIANPKVAIGITPRIHEMPFESIQERLDGMHPMSPQRRVYDTGTKKKTVLDPSPAGPSERPEGADDRTSHTNVGSGYDKGLDPGGQADDETGPGNTLKQDKEQTFMDSTTSELASKSDSDTSSKLSPLNWGSNSRDRKTTDHLLRMYRQPTAIRRRTPVAWSHSFDV